MGTDENDIALGIQRLLRQRVTTVCFMEGHGEYPFDNFEFHTHVESVQAHSHGDKSSALVQMEAHGAGRLRRALEALGYETRKIVTATLRAIPPDCAAVVAANPRTTYLPAESELLTTYLAQGGAALLMYDLGFVLEPRLAALLARLGVSVEQQVVVDPLDHYSTDYETVAIPVYEAHPITSRVALTFFPGIRPLKILPKPPGVVVAPLFKSSKESYTRPVAPVGAQALTREVVSIPAPPPAGRDRRGAARRGLHRGHGALRRSARGPVVRQVRGHRAHARDPGADRSDRADRHGSAAPLRPGGVGSLDGRGCPEPGVGAARVAPRDVASLHARRRAGPRDASRRVGGRPARRVRARSAAVRHRAPSGRSGRPRDGVRVDEPAAGGPVRPGRGTSGPLPHAAVRRAGVGARGGRHEPAMSTQPWRRRWHGSVAVAGP